MKQAAFYCDAKQWAILQSIPRSVNIEREFNALISENPPTYSRPKAETHPFRARLTPENERLVEVLKDHGSKSEYFRGILDLLLEKLDGSTCLHNRTTCNDCGSIPFKV